MKGVRYRHVKICPPQIVTDTARSLQLNSSSLHAKRRSGWLRRYALEIQNDFN
jgi:hypothetical protein